MLNLDKTIICGGDMHKDMHYFVLIDNYGKELNTYSVSNTEPDLEQWLDKIDQEKYNQYRDKDLIFALEDTNGNGFLASRKIYHRGYKIFPISPHWTEKSRKRSPHIEKSDYLDAKRIAKILLTESENVRQLTLTFKSEELFELRGLLNYYQDLTNLLTKIRNQIHRHLHKQFGANYKKYTGYKMPFCKKSRLKFIEILEQSKKIEAKIIVSKLKMYGEIEQQQKLYHKLLNQNSSPELESLSKMSGAGPIVAHKILIAIEDINRFRSHHALARYAGIAPREHSSVKVKHFIDFRGNRKLNQAIHRMSLVRVSPNGGCHKMVEYYQKKIKEGKSKNHALRCVKRKTIRDVYYLLKHSVMKHLTG